MKKIIYIALVVGFVLVYGHPLYAQTTGISTGSSSTSPSISVTHPSVGDSYVPGNTLTVNWVSSGVPASASIDVILQMDPRSPNRGMYNGCIGGPFSACMAMHSTGDRFLPAMHVVTANTGSVSFTLPASYLPSGKYYFELQASSLLGGVLTTYAATGMDTSKFFTINSDSKNTGVVKSSSSLAPITIGKTLSFGQTDPQIKILQQYLIAHGYLSGGATGFYGGMTKIAVQKLQADLGITSNGASVGAATRAALSGIK